MPELGVWGWSAIIAALVAGIATIAERRRHNRRDIEKVGFMPWTFIMIMALLGAVICAALALKIG